MADKLPWGLQGTTKGSAKNIPESKLKAFNIGSMNVKKSLSKRDLEEQKKKEEQQKAAEVYQEFVASFEEPSKVGKTWVKGGTFNDKDGKKVSDRGKLYKPTSKLAELASTFSSSREAKKRDDDKPSSAKKKDAKEKKKSNLEMFKEELKIIQEERQERHKYKHAARENNKDDDEGSEGGSRFENIDPIQSALGRPSIMEDFKNPYADNDSVTTNLYLGNINPKMSEQQLCEIFGHYGPLASVKIMWPRSDEERARNRNCGFVAYMNRKDGERALAGLKGRDFMGFEMKLGWGKSVPIPPHPVYIPPAMVKMSLPPPPSGLPFNAQPRKKRSQRDRYGPQDQQADEEEFDKTLQKAVVKVVVPTERTLLAIIHRVIEFVVREGPMFEAMIMNRELNNPQYRFLFENQSPAHVYYRWKLFTILQGDEPYRWKTEEFRMFKGGSLWRPPKMNPYTEGMPSTLVEKKNQSKKGQLTDKQRDMLEDMLRDLTPERIKIGDAMMWCMVNAESAEEIVECIAESLSILQTPIPKKIARLFLISDILHNTGAKIPNASFFRKYFQRKLPDIFKDVHEAYENIEGRLKAEQFKQKVMLCFRAWEDWAVYPNDFLINLQNVFLGLVSNKEEVKVEDVDGAPLDNVLADMDDDGVPLDDLDGAPLGRHESLDGQSVEDLDGEELDGAPIITEDIDGEPIKKEEPAAAKFIPSKWETVDSSELENQAMTTSKWDQLEPEPEEEEEDNDGRPLEDEEGEELSSDESPSRELNSSALLESLRAEITEERRAKLREIELKVMKYQDELEAGKRSRKMEMSISQQVEQYRQKLLQKEKDKEEGKLRERLKERKREAERERVREWERARNKVRERETREVRERSSSSESGSFPVPTRSPLPSLVAYGDDSPVSSSGRKRSRRSKSPSERSRSRRRRSRSRSPSKRSKRSGSRSPSSRHKHKHKKSKR